MRVVMLTTSFPRWANDYFGIFVFRLARALSRRGVDVTVVAPHSSGLRDFEVMDQVKVFRFRYGPSFLERTYGTWYAHELRGVARKIESWLRLLSLPLYFISAFLCTIIVCKISKKDVIFSHWAVPSGFIGSLCSAILRIPHVVKCYGGDVVVTTKKPFLGFIVKAVLKHSRFVLTNSLLTKKDVEKLGIQGDKIRVTYELIELNVPKNSIKETRCKLGIGDNEKFIFSLGRLVPYKGFEYLIRSMAFLDKNIILVIGGDGPLKEELQALARKLKVSQRCRFVGAIPQEELPNFYSACDIYVSSSIYDEEGNREGFAVTVAEAMGYGKPVVVTDEGAQIELIKDGNNGLVARAKDPQDLASKILICAKHSHIARTIAFKAQNDIAQHFSCEKITSLVMDALNKACKS